jgi:FkbM family methyltransferase
MKNGEPIEYFSQYGQDKILDQEIFKGKTSGFFIEIGAYDGIRFSNTYFFEKYRRWKGICVEPIKSRYDELVKNRKSLNLNCCIASNNKPVKFSKISGYAEMLSGITSKYDKKHKKRINLNLNEKGGSIEEIEVQAITLNDLFEQNKIKEADYCSIDTEGSELDILNVFDFNKYKIKAFSIENNYNDLSLKKFMQSRNYELFKTVECDEIYILRDLK